MASIALSNQICGESTAKRALIIVKTFEVRLMLMTIYQFGNIDICYTKIPVQLIVSQPRVKDISCICLESYEEYQHQLNLIYSTS